MDLTFEDFNYHLKNPKILWQDLLNNKFLNLENLKFAIREHIIGKENFIIQDLILLSCIVYIDDSQMFKNFTPGDLFIINIQICVLNKYFQLGHFFLNTMKEDYIDDVHNVDKFLSDNFYKALYIAIEKIFDSYKSNFINFYPIITIGSYDIITGNVKDILWNSDCQLKNVIRDYIN